MAEQLFKETQIKMDKAVAALDASLTKVRTGRAHPSLIEGIMVSYYGTDTPLSQVASVSVADARTLSVVPWEKTMVAPIEKAIMISDLGLNPATSGNNIRIPLPALTEERRKDLIKLVRQEAEGAKVSIRNCRRDTITRLKSMEKDGDITEDDLRQFEQKAQNMTDAATKKIEEVVAEKEKDLMTV
jgi:ribosome recycling factor